MGAPFSAAGPVDGVIMPIFKVGSLGPQALIAGSTASIKARQVTAVTINNLLFFIFSPFSIMGCFRLGYYISAFTSFFGLV